MNLTDFVNPVINPKDNGVQFYDEFRGELTYSQRHKSEQLHAYGSIRYIGDGKFICLPLNEKTEVSWCGMTFAKTPYVKFYNTTTYLITRDGPDFRCNCIGFTTKDKKFKAGLSPNPPFCAHLHALMISFKNKEFEHG